MPGWAPLAVLVIFCAAAVYTDLRYGKIPNPLNGMGFAFGVLLASLERGAGGLAESVTGSLLGISILLVPFLLHMVGGGDVKFLAAAGALVGWRILMPSFLAGAALGGAIGLALIITRDRSLTRIRHRIVLLQAGVWRRPTSLRPSRDHEKPGSLEAHEYDVRMPYALPMSLGLVIVTSMSLFT